MLNEWINILKLDTIVSHKPFICNIPRPYAPQGQRQHPTGSPLYPLQLELFAYSNCCPYCCYWIYPLKGVKYMIKENAMLFVSSSPWPFATVSEVLGAVMKTLLVFKKNESS